MFVLNGVAFVFGLLFSIPVIGRLIREGWDLLFEVVWRIVGLPELVLGLFGVERMKRLGICIIILRDQNGDPVAAEADLDSAIAAAQRIFADAANVNLVVEGIHTVSDPTPARNLDVGCNMAAWLDDLWLPGSYFEITANRVCFEGAWRRLIGWAAPVVVYVVRGVAGATDGCSLGPASDYVTIEGKDSACLAHEIAHACSLLHHGDKDNLLHPKCGGIELTRLQRALLRNSRHVALI